MSTKETLEELGFKEVGPKKFFLHYQESQDQVGVKLTVKVDEPYEGRFTMETVIEDGESEFDPEEFTNLDDLTDEVRDWMLG